MSRKSPVLKNARLCAFKAIRDSGVIAFQPLTVFIGNNGSGKSSIIEGLEAFQTLVLDGPDAAFQPWRGLEHIWNKAVSHKQIEGQVGRLQRANPVSFEVNGRHGHVAIAAKAAVHTDMRYDAFRVETEGELSSWAPWVRSWQFLSLKPSEMLYPRPDQRFQTEIRLEKNGSNIAQYLQSIVNQDAAVLEDIAATLKTVLPYAEVLEPAITRELERTVYLRLREQGIEEQLAGWLLSQGTLRIVALLAVFRHPSPPSVVFIEELENGLDPRTIHLVIEEIRAFIDAGGQVVATSHSPYLLDLLDLSHIIVVERGRNGAPTFRRPNKAKLKGWAEKFAPGRLYTMGNLTEQ